MKYVLILLSFISIAKLNAQMEGIKLSAGINYFWLESEIQAAISDNPMEVLYKNGDYGYDIGYGLLYRLNTKLLLGTDLNYSDRYRKQVDPAGIQQTVKYVGLQPKIYYKIGDSLKPYSGFGINYLIVKRSSADIDMDSDRSFYSNIDVSIHGGLAFKLPLFELFADFHFGLNPQRKIVLAEDFTTEVKVNSKSRLLRVGLSYIIESKDTSKEKKRKKKKRRRR